MPYHGIKTNQNITVFQDHLFPLCNFECQVNECFDSHLCTNLMNDNTFYLEYAFKTKF